MCSPPEFMHSHALHSILYDGMLSPLVSQGKLKYHETVTEGFDHMFDAFMGLFSGKNLGKAVVKA